MRELYSQFLQEIDYSQQLQQAVQNSKTQVHVHVINTTSTCCAIAGGGLVSTGLCLAAAAVSPLGVLPGVLPTVFGVATLAPSTAAGTAARARLAPPLLLPPLLALYCYCVA
jgi:hypothetical protein